MATSPSTLLEERIDRSRLSERQMAAAVGVVLILFLIGTAYLAGVLADPFDVDFWRSGLAQEALKSLKNASTEPYTVSVPGDYRVYCIESATLETIAGQRHRELPSIGGVG